MASLEITIDKAGEITSVVKGIKGKECGKADSFLHKLGEVVTRKETPEYWEQVGSTVRTIRHQQ